MKPGMLGEQSTTGLHPHWLEHSLEYEWCPNFPGRILISSWNTGFKERNLSLKHIFYNPHYTYFLETGSPAVCAFTLNAPRVVSY